MTAIKGIEAQARPLPLLIMADTSGSMGEMGKISALNQALASLVQDLRSDPLTTDAVLFSLLTFGGTVNEVVTLEPVKKVQLPILTAGGNTPMGQALRIALGQLGDKSRLPTRCLSPVMVLATDAQSTDDWQGPLNEIKAHPRVGGALRLALAIGADVQLDVLEAFVSAEYPVLKADESDKIKTFFRFVTYATQKVFKSGGRDRSTQAPAELLP
jgi:uncharacterized protein YegL